MRARDVGDDADLGARDLGEVRDLAGRAHRHLQHPGRLTAARREDRQRQADLGVEAAGRAQHVAERSERRRHELLGRRLARSSPVTATTWPRNCARARRARDRPARGADRRRRSRRRPRSPAGRPRARATTTPAAPAADRLRRERRTRRRARPAARRRAARRSTARLSSATPANDGAARARLQQRPVHRPRRRSRACACGRAHAAPPAARAKRGGLLAIVEVAPRGADDLVVLVPLAGDEHDVAGPGGASRRRDRRAPVDLDVVAARRSAERAGRELDTAGAPDPIDDHGDDAGRVLGARIVGRDDRQRRRRARRSRP